jgi:menaquinone-dependent protoporphyrinogen oxidase
MMRVLVAYGTKMGGSAGIAEMLGDALSTAGLQVDVRPASERADIGAYDAVIVGGALYNQRWHRHARRFVSRHTSALRTRPVWLFSSGPLDDSATTGEIAPIAQVQDLLQRVGARGHATFGGRLAPDAKGLPASAMAKTRAGDWRDPTRIRSWAATVAQELTRPARDPELRAGGRRPEAPPEGEAKWNEATIPGWW